MIEKGYCFEINGNSFLVMGDAILFADTSKVYLCQELTGKHRMMVFAEREIENASASIVEERTTARSVEDKKQEERPMGITSTSVQDLMIDFLEAEYCSDKLKILEEMKGKATLSMYKSMACSLDYDTDSNSVEEIYYALERYLKTRIRYEGKRLR